MLQDEALERVGTLSLAEGKDLGFDIGARTPAAGAGADVAEDLGRWNAVIDASSNKTYFANIDTKAVAWELPAGARIVGRVMPSDHPIVLRHRSVAGAMDELQRLKDAAARREADEMGEGGLAAQAAAGNSLAAAAAAAAVARASSHRWTQTKEGFMHKSDGKGGRFAKRWLVLDCAMATLSWYQDPPASSAARLGAAVEPKGSMSVAGASVALLSPAPRGVPTQWTIQVESPSRRMLLCAFSEDDAQSWLQYLEGVASGAVRGALAGGGAAAPVDYGVEAREGWLEVSSPDGRAGSFVRLWAQLDPASRLLLLFKSEAREPGSERAVVDCLSMDVFEAFPTPDAGGIAAAPQAPSPSAHAFWLAVEDAADPEGSTTSVFGKGPGRTASCSAVVCASAEERAAWLGCLGRARDDRTMHMPSEEQKAAAPILSMSLLHNQVGAGFFSALGSVAERKVIVVPAKKQLSVYGDAKGTSVRAVLELNDERVRFVFACDDRSPLPAFGNLRIELTAPAVGAASRALAVHVLRARNSAELLAWAGALAAL